MNRFFALILLFFSASISFAQDVVEWNISYSNEETIEISATIDDGWHLYSQHLTSEFGPIPTSFEFQENANVQLVDSVQEPKPILHYDPNFQTELHFFEKEVTFSQQLNVEKETELSGSVTFMVCNEAMCLPPEDYEFSLTVKPNHK